MTVTARNIHSNATSNTTLSLLVQDINNGSYLDGTSQTVLTRGYVSFGPKKEQLIIRTILPKSFVMAAGTTMTMKFNDLSRTFSFDAKGRKTSGIDSASLSKRGANVQFYTMIRGALKDAITAGVSVNAKGQPLAAIFQITVAGTPYSAVERIYYFGPPHRQIRRPVVRNQTVIGLKPDIISVTPLWRHAFVLGVSADAGRAVFTSAKHDILTPSNFVILRLGSKLPVIRRSALKNCLSQLARYARAERFRCNQ